MNWRAFAVLLAIADVIALAAHRPDVDVTTGIIGASGALIFLGLLNVFCADEFGEYKGYIQGGCYISRPTPAGMFVFFGLFLLALPVGFALCEFVADGGAAKSFRTILPTLTSLHVSNATSRPEPPRAFRFTNLRDAELEAVRRYPELGIGGSRLNAAFIQRFQIYRRERPEYFSDLSWPIQLAEETAGISTPSH